MKFTVIIPTRERADTLYYALKTCVTQDYDNLEILVSDNCSQDNTKEVVESFKDPRIRYINTGKRVSMTSNWEFALHHVDTGYVGYLGDDDGLMPNAIADVTTILEKHPAAAVSWGWAWYTWPMHPLRPNYLSVPLRTHLVNTPSRKFIRDVVRGHAGYYRGPCLYNGMVSVQAIAKIRSKCGRFFASAVPDVYSSYALPSVIDTYLFSERPFSVAGQSAKSNGAQWMQPIVRGHEQDHGDRFLTESDFSFHALCPIIPGCQGSGILEPLLQANDNCYNGILRIPIRKRIAVMIKEAATKEAETYQYIMRSVEEVARAANVTTFYRIWKTFFPNRPRKYTFSPPGLVNYNSLAIDVTPFGIDNVADAAVWVERILGKYQIPLKLKKYSCYRRYTWAVVRRLMPWIERY